MRFSRWFLAVLCILGLAPLSANADFQEPNDALTNCTFEQLLYRQVPDDSASFSATTSSTDADYYPFPVAPRSTVHIEISVDAAPYLVVSILNLNGRQLLQPNNCGAQTTIGLTDWFFDLQDEVYRATMEIPCQFFSTYVLYVQGTTDTVNYTVHISNTWGVDCPNYMDTSLVSTAGTGVLEGLGVDWNFQTGERAGIAAIVDTTNYAAAGHVYVGIVVDNHTYFLSATGLEDHMVPYRALQMTGSSGLYQDYVEIADFVPQNQVEFDLFVMTDEELFPGVWIPKTTSGTWDYVHISIK